MKDSFSSIYFFLINRQQINEINNKINSNTKNEIISNSPKNNISSSPKSSFLSEKPKVQYQPGALPVKSDSSNSLHNIENPQEPIQQQQQVKYINKYSNNSDSEYDANKAKEQESKVVSSEDARRERSFLDLQKIPKSSKARVRISSVVENIETHEHYEINRHSSMLDNDEGLSEGEETIHPYELTKPIKLQAKVENEPTKSNHRSNSYDSDSNSRHQPKIIEKQRQVEIASRAEASSPSSRLANYNRHSSAKSSFSSDNNKSEENIQNSENQNVICFLRISKTIYLSLGINYSRFFSLKRRNLKKIIDNN